jgi:SH3 domain-containing protein
MAVRTQHVTTRSPRYALGPGADLPIARIVALCLLAIPVLAFFLIKSLASAGPSPEAQQIASINPRTLFSDNTPHFLPPPVAALPPEQDAGPPSPAADEPTADTEQVKVANTGGVGAILRAEPPSGRQVAGLRDGQVLTVLEHRTVGDSEWLHVKTRDGNVEGWVYGRLVGPAQ